MKKQYLKPFALSTLVIALSGCGGESGNLINENDSGNVTVSASCNTSASNCLGFVLDYPVEGLNFNCSSDSVHNFITATSGNAVTGACKLGDEVTFAIKGNSTTNQISLGTLDLDKITTLKIGDARISLIDIATALNNGREPTSLSATDSTIKVAMALVKIFQAAGVQQAQNVAGDIQPVSLSENFKAELSKATDSVKLSNYLDGSYAAIIRNWVDVSNITDDQAFDLVRNLANQNMSGLYLSDFLAFSISGTASTDTASFEGFHGTANARRELIANMYLLTDRTGNSFGYGMQWKGVPVSTSDNSSLLRINLLSQVQPQKMTATTQQTWLNPLTKRIEINAPFSLSVADDQASIMKITQGKLLNGLALVGNESAYKAYTKATTGVPTDYAKWSQTVNGFEDYTGSLEVSKTNPVTYLNRDVFRTIKSVNSGEKYYFPLYADLEFKFTDSSVSPVKLGIVIDENGDIRSNIRSGATTDDMSSGNVCATVDANMMGSNGVQQYRIGTLGAANSSTGDKSLTMRIILADPAFNKLEGLIMGINQALSIAGTGGTLSSTGVKLNINNLLAGGGEGNLATITTFANTVNGGVAQWANIYAIYQAVYNKQAGTNSNLPAPTNAQKDLAKRTGGSVTTSVSLPSCYTNVLLPTMVKP